MDLKREPIGTLASSDLGEAPKLGKLETNLN